MDVDALLTGLRSAFTEAADPQRAVAMAAYMRDRHPFLGLAADRQRAVARTVTRGWPRPTEGELESVARAAWELPEREFQYFACDYLRAHVAVPGPGFIVVLRSLITAKSWWDTIDPLATRVVGPLVRRHPALTATMDEWSRERDLWLVRTAILHQLHYGAETDTARLFGYCTAQAGHADFFVRKAIGWALRQYARTDPAAVRAYVAAADLSPLSLREATKHL